MRRSFAERLLEHLSATAPLARGARLRQYHVRPKGVVVLVSGVPGDGGILVRLPLDERAAEACARHQTALTTLARDERLPAHLRALFPFPLAAGCLEGQPFFAETALAGDSGKRYYTRSGRRYDLAISGAATLLGVLRGATEETVRIDDADFERLCGRWLAECTALLDDAPLRDTLEAVGDLLRRTLIGTTLPLGWHHGDFDFCNLLYGGHDQVTGVLDFELFDERGLPLVDLLFLLARRPLRRERLRFGPMFTRSILHRNLPSFENRLLTHEMDTIGADERLYRGLALCCWINHLRLGRDSWLLRSPSWLDTNVRAVAADVRRTL